MAQQPPLSKTLSVQSSPSNPLTLANGFPASPGTTPNTFAVDPDFRVGYAHNWQVLVQRDLPASLTMNATYLGTHGSHLMQEFLPNTAPIGVPAPVTLPSGFVYLTSNGRSDRHTGQLQLRRRLRGRLTGASLEAPDGSFANPAAYAAPAPGQWGDAGRNSISGPRVFSLDAGLGRTFLWGDRLNLDWRMNATNILNRVTYAAVNTI